MKLDRNHPFILFIAKESCIWGLQQTWPEGTYEGHLFQDAFQIHSSCILHTSSRYQTRSSSWSKWCLRGWISTQY
jgi:hypothetical protein